MILGYDPTMISCLKARRMNRRGSSRAANDAFIIDPAGYRD